MSRAARMGQSFQYHSIGKRITAARDFCNSAGCDNEPRTAWIVDRQGKRMILLCDCCYERRVALDTSRQSVP
jgi:hypothetical protein